MPRLTAESQALLGGHLSKMKRVPVKPNSLFLLLPSRLRLAYLVRSLES